MNRVVITTIGQDTHIFKDRETYPEDLCQDIEDIISGSSQKLSKGDGLGKITIKLEKGDVILSVKDGNPVMNDEGNSIILLRFTKKCVNTKCYYGKSSVVDFVIESGNYGRDVDTIKEFYKAWKVSGNGSAVPILLVEESQIFSAVVKDEFFKDFIILKVY